MEASTLGVDPMGWEPLQNDMATIPKHHTTRPPGGQRQIHLPTSGALRKVLKDPLGMEGGSLQVRAPTLCQAQGPLKVTRSTES